WTPDPEAFHLFNREFIFHHRVVPIGVSEGSLRVAMCDPFNLKTLDTIERITGFRPVPYLALEDEFEQFFEALTPEPEPETRAQKVL
ncbi:MAG TPA: hypothetical protein P5561_04650, partial [Candidatus Omnitrophota bacterium]|nr:hypothetical protein [Candidatus Omnitrophota bacterium]